MVRNLKVKDLKIPLLFKTSWVLRRVVVLNLISTFNMIIYSYLQKGLYAKAETN